MLWSMFGGVEAKDKLGYKGSILKDTKQRYLVGPANRQKELPQGTKLKKRRGQLFPEQKTHSNENY